jgi:hypothetical protein
MKTKKIILFVFIIVLLGSCAKYLEPYPNGNYDSQTLWQYQNLVQGLIGYCYDNIAAYTPGTSNRNYNDNEGTYMDGATDDAVITSSTYVLDRYAANSMTTSQDPFATYWDRDYRSIRNCNLFLKDRRGYNTKFEVVSHLNDLVKNRLQGEAFALRAWFEWDLLQKFGGQGTDGTMLGFPIITDVYGATDIINVPRNTYDDCVKQIISDCDSAWKYLPIAYRDFLVPSADRTYAGGKYWDRLDGITTRAIKANVYLTWASPRFNPSNILARWDSAAVNAKSVIDFKMTIDAVGGNSFTPAANVVWTNPNSPEIVFSTRYNTSNNYMEKLFYPGGFQGTASIGATQELVDAFPDTLGYPITSPLSVYNPAKPYAKRDARFYSSIYYNTAIAYRNNTKTVANIMYTFENWNLPAPGKDAANTSATTNRTNYYIKKFVFMGWNPSDASVSTVTHSKFCVRWAQMMLTFAEAANQVVGPLDETRYGMSARTAIEFLRARKTYDGAVGLCTGVPTLAAPVVLTAVQDPYLFNTANSGAAAFDVLIRNERRIELCFEGTRFYDLRRWTTDANWSSVLNGTVHGAYITQVPGTPVTYTYNLAYPVETRSFPSPYNPIPYSEVLRMNKLVQNTGWTSWN